MANGGSLRFFIASTVSISVIVRIDYYRRGDSIASIQGNTKGPMTQVYLSLFPSRLIVAWEKAKNDGHSYYTPGRNRDISPTTVNGLRFALTTLSTLSKDLNGDVTFATIVSRCHKQSTIPSLAFNDPASTHLCRNVIS